MWCRLSMVFLLILIVSSMVPAQDAPPDAGKKGAKTIDQVVADFQKYPGFFTLYRQVKPGDTTLLMEVREEQLETPFFLQATFVTGAGTLVQAGEPLLDMVIVFKRTPDDRLLLATPNLAYRAKAGTSAARAVSRDFPEGYLEVFPIVAKQAERNSLLIDVGDFFLGDVTGISAYFSRSGGFSRDKDTTFITTVKSFPQNSVVEVNYHFVRSAAAAFNDYHTGSVLADPRSLPVKVVYNLWPMPAPGYRPRLADLRVGYFVSGELTGPGGFEDVGNDTNADPYIYYISRWRLEKADPAAAMSPPRQPITFWLDPAIPMEYRDAVRDGILWWNMAFERIGFQQAIAVRDLPADADWDPADMRYNLVHWDLTPWADGHASFGYLREDPRTGEIVNAAIIIDSSFTRAGRMQDRYLVAPEENTIPVPTTNRFSCECARGLLREGWYGSLALQLLSPDGTHTDETAFVQALLRETVAHEVGHVLGLRHNFRASTYLPADQLCLTRNAVSGSVMDYNPFNLFAVGQPDVQYFSASIGNYDQWAIEYGYAPLEAQHPEDELPALQAIAARTNEPGLPFASDELVNRFDPAIASFDLGQDPLAYTEASFQLNQRLMKSLEARMPQSGEGYREFTRNVLMLLRRSEDDAETAMRFIGGYHVRINRRGDPNQQPSLTPVPAGQQYRALQQINTYIFSGQALVVPASYYQQFIFNPHTQGDTLAANAFPMRQEIGRMQQDMLRALFAPARLTRIANGEFIAGGATFRLLDLFTSVREAIWSPLGKKTPISPLTRDLQRAHLDLMLELTGNRQIPADARLLAGETLRVLRPKLAAAGRAYKDDYTRLHLTQAVTDIDKAIKE